MKMNVSLGLDLSLCETGYFVTNYRQDVIDKGIIVSYKYGEDALVELIRIRGIIAEVKSIIERIKPDIIAIEGIAFGVNKTRSLAQLSALNYMVRDLCYNLGIDFIVVPPTTNKKFATGSGKAKKEDMIKWYQDKYKTTDGNNNIADAAGLALYGLTKVKY